MLHDLNWLKENWAKAMELSEYFSLDRHSPEEKRETWNRIAQNYDTALGSDVQRAKEAVDLLQAKGAVNDETVAMDIGCGTGVYALELAKHCKHVYALDYSEGMLEKLGAKIAEKGLKNITPIQADWKTFDYKTLGEKITLSISCLNTGMRDFDSLVKINEVTKGWCCYITSSGLAKAANRNELQELVFGRTLNNVGGGDIIYPFTIIYALGFKPELSYIPCKWSRVKSAQAALDDMIADFNRYLDINDAMRDKLAEYVQGRLNEEGNFAESVNAMMGVMIWKTVGN